MGLMEFKHLFSTIHPMKSIIVPILTLITFFGCAPKPVALLQEYPNTLMTPSNGEELDGYKEEDYDELLENFRNNCRSSRTKKLYASTCKLAEGNISNAAVFFKEHFSLYEIEPTAEKPILTGYYEPLLYGSLQQSERFKYPLYYRPEDMLQIELSALFPELKNKRVRGRLVGKKVIPYLSREEINRHDLNASVICYVDNKIDRFFLEVQGSGRVKLDCGNDIFVGYADQNGHPYRSIGKELINRGILRKEEVSLQSIKRYLLEHPDDADSVLYANPSTVFFSKRNTPATGAMGLVLTPERSVAIDRRYIPLGALLFVQSDSEAYRVSRFVFAQDTGGAIRGAVRADMFMGYGERAERIAGALNAPLKMWMALPKELSDEH